MTATVISLAEVTRARGLCRPTAIRLSDPVRRRTGLAEGFVMDFRGRGSPDDPVEALVQWAGIREWIPVAFLEPAPRDWQPPAGAA